MNKIEFNQFIAEQLRNGNNKVAYCKDDNCFFTGGLCDTLQEAVTKTMAFYKDDPNVNITIADYREAVTIYEKEDILIEANKMNIQI